MRRLALLLCAWGCGGAPGDGQRGPDAPLEPPLVERPGGGTDRSPEQWGFCPVALPLDPPALARSESPPACLSAVDLSAGGEGALVVSAGWDAALLHVAGGLAQHVLPLAPPTELAGLAELQVGSYLGVTVEGRVVGVRLDPRKSGVRASVGALEEGGAPCGRGGAVRGLAACATDEGWRLAATCTQGDGAAIALGTATGAPDAPSVRWQSMVPIDSPHPARAVAPLSCGEDDDWVVVLDTEAGSELWRYGALGAPEPVAALEARVGAITPRPGGCLLAVVEERRALDRAAACAPGEACPCPPEVSCPCPEGSDCAGAPPVWCAVAGDAVMRRSTLRLLCPPGAACDGGEAAGPRIQP